MLWFKVRSAWFSTAGFLIFKFAADEKIKRFLFSNQIDSDIRHLKKINH